ncbi:ABC transporter ATP-binding protein [Quatrionicoccus australiensis]|uniref:ABC transporter ATP-binding protein n=1 Tax=Quatrionicoccus australiensis TaxID=138118 RepID=UPI001CF8A05A|nr:ABC transporter ATP-binding protein [Quatrionicoccus australiensis]UCV15721.1 ABC transporter ATP-binding protein [Quatrionicoccus australiensis]
MEFGADGIAIRVRDVGMRFTLADGSERTALEGISFDLQAGAFLAVIGQSGCGKSTLLRLLMGLAQPSEGSIRMFGATSLGRKLRCAMVFQHAELFPWRTALGNIEFGLEVAGVPADLRRKRAWLLLEQLGLQSAAELRPHQLSGGMRQRVGLARALATEPDILLMDEPFAALDACTRADLQVELNRLHEGSKKTVVFVTHDVDEASALADSILVMTPQGRVMSHVATGLQRPRGDLEKLRTSSDFAQMRYMTAQLLRRPESGEIL